MAVECVLSQLVVRFDGDLALLGLLAPEDRHASSDLDVREHISTVVEADHKLSLHVVRHITMFIEAPGVEASACHCEASSGDQSHV